MESNLEFRGDRFTSKKSKNNSPRTGRLSTLILWDWGPRDTTSPKRPLLWKRVANLALLYYRYNGHHHSERYLLSTDLLQLPCIMVLHGFQA